MAEVDSITAELMANGAPFEVIDLVLNGTDQRVFKNAPDNLNGLIDTARAHGEKEFVIHNERRLSYTDFIDEAEHLAAWLVREGQVQPGQSVALVMRNSIEWLQSFVAIIRAGGVAVLVNSRNEPENLKSALDDTDCRFMFCDAKRYDALRSVGCDLPALVSEPCAGQMQICDAIAAKMPYEAVHVDSDAPACMFFTSGTTGRAKAAVVSHRSLITGTMNTQLAMAESFAKIAKTYNITVEELKKHIPQSCSLLVFPLFHTAGCSAVFLTGLATGAKLVMMDRWDANGAIELIAREKITNFGGVPAMHWDMLNALKTRDDDLSSIASLSCGGQAFPLSLIEALRAQFPSAVLGMGYGMTETCGAVSQANGDVFLQFPRSSGQILPMVNVRIVGEQGEDMDTAQAGEVWVRGATVMMGYYGRPEETAASFTDGWLRTGDIGYIDENGFLYIVDRKTDMIISGGENIYCAEVEQALSKHPLTKQVVTFGMPDERMGERLVACVEALDDTLGREDILSFARETLADYKVPSDVLIVTEALERNAMGKVEKHKLRDKYQSYFTREENA